MNLKLCFVFVFLLSFKLYSQSQFIIVLGVAQDGGYPHLGCEKKCCNSAWQNDSIRKNVVSLALVDNQTKQWWLFEATPDIKIQIQNFKNLTKGEFNYLPSSIFITHAHIGHYTGLMQLGREVLNAKEIPVYTLPKLKNFIENNGPWSQLVSLKNISLLTLDSSVPVILTSNISVNTFTVPHRDEYSETAGFKINTLKNSYLFIPDIDKWEKWDKKIIEEVSKVNYAFIDATFSSIDELKNRKPEEVPHPLITETIKLFENCNIQIKNKIYFIHFNHTNPVLWDKAEQFKLKQKGFNIAEEGKWY